MYDTIESAARAEGLQIYGALHPRKTAVPQLTGGTLILLGTGAEYWPVFSRSPECQDDQRDPVDRWSSRIIGTLAESHSATAYFPFGGPPHAPFFSWALASGRAFSSPAMLLVHDSVGMMVSFRGALHFAEEFEIPPPPLSESPCLSCDGQPCTTTCPVGAMNANGNYGLHNCYDFLDTLAGQECMDQGCLARRACPLSQQSGRDPAQTAHHMRYFKT
jgi:hypothetical protein